MMASTVPVSTELENTVFLWGANSYGQLGLGHKEDTLTLSWTVKGLMPTQIPFHLTKLRQITGGGGHTLLLTEDGTVYSFGWNKNGQLGISFTIPDLTKPEPLLGLALKITKVSCGWNHSLALTEHGRVFVWGSNTYRQLGVPSVQKQADSPVELPTEPFSNSRVCNISAGLRHSVALTEDGRVYTWGDARKGQLGHGKENLSFQNEPKQVKALLPHKCKSVAAGVYHSAAIKEDGIVTLWGLNQHGQCCIGEKAESFCLTIPVDQVNLTDTNWISNVYLPCDVVGLPPVSDVHCGWSHTVVISVHRQVYTWGRSDYGQLGYKHKTTDSAQRTGAPVTCCHIPREIPELKGVKQVACGSEHNIAICADNRIVTFGWNEHGMCGTGDEVDVHIPHIVTTGKFEPLMVGAGAGHSMVAARRLITSQCEQHAYGVSTTCGD